MLQHCKRQTLSKHYRIWPIFLTCTQYNVSFKTRQIRSNSNQLLKWRLFLIPLSLRCTSLVKCQQCWKNLSEIQLQIIVYHCKDKKKQIPFRRRRIGTRNPIHIVPLAEFEPGSYRCRQGKIPPCQPDHLWSRATYHKGWEHKTC